MQSRELVAFDLKAARKEKHLSQIATAEILCTTQPTVSRWEREGTLPAICRKAWDQHWELETLKNDNMHASKPSVDVPDMQKRDRENEERRNDRASIRRNQRSKRKGPKARRVTLSVIRGGKEISNSIDARSESLSVVELDSDSEG